MFLVVDDRLEARTRLGVPNLAAPVMASRDNDGAIPDEVH
jgi:hypothetical protein